ncbi:hypothetical protein CJ97_gp35 [Ralstonia phage RSB2]|uniref:Uncharacterized protein ORF35 n=1 Tax=Ralstonia phage RSB2 TaxID=913183 RepID=E5RV15_9CAUD|nr:hypothetical protein CJ97_gp35 [Ralstonia phage RSB2]BAJ51823.1 hypothetical protein [Ralstonia phage RSB2]
MASGPQEPRLSLRVQLCTDLGFMSETLVATAWAESPLIQRAFPTAAAYWEYQCRFHAGCPQVQITLHTPEGITVGGIVLCSVEDAQVGDALMALHTFILPEYRSARNLLALKREARWVARNSNIRWIIYPRRTPEGILHKHMEV